MISWQKLKTGWLKARIAYHRRQANSYSRHVARSFKRDSYSLWTHSMALRHSMKAHDLERKLLLFCNGSVIFSSPSLQASSAPTPPR